MRNILTHIGSAVLLSFILWLVYYIGKDVGYAIGIREEDSIKEK